VEVATLTDPALLRTIRALGIRLKSHELFPRA
jgi:hypothetical protein